MEVKCDEEELEKFKSTHLRFLREPIVVEFLKDYNNLRLVKDAIVQPTFQNTKKVDMAFKNFYTKAKIASYISKLVYFNSVHFDQRERKINDREPLIFDQPISDGINEYTIGEQTYAYNPIIETQFESRSIEDVVDSPILYQALKRLSDKQKDILTLFYIHGHKNKEIAKLLADSPQNISQQHKRALKKLREKIEEVDKND